MKITDLDICRIFGNLLENAVRAVKADKETEEPYVNCICRVRMGKLLIDIENSYSGKYEEMGMFFIPQATAARESGQPPSAKRLRNTEAMQISKHQRAFFGPMYLSSGKQRIMRTDSSGILS